MNIVRIALPLGAAIALSACAPQSKYAWGSYEPALYAYYKTPGAAAAFANELNESITNAEANGGKVPPGLYAEYGNMLLEQGKGKEAAVYFEKEKAAWPESATLMSRLAQMASRPDGQDGKSATHATTPAGDAEASAAASASGNAPAGTVTK